MDSGTKFVVFMLLSLVGAYVFFSIVAPDIIRATGAQPLEFNWHLF